jgi:hypothetical protein
MGFQSGEKSKNISKSLIKYEETSWSTFVPDYVRDFLANNFLELQNTLIFIHPMVTAAKGSKVRAFNKHATKIPSLERILDWLGLVMMPEAQYLARIFKYDCEKTLTMT